MDDFIFEHRVHEEKKLLLLQQIMKKNEKKRMPDKYYHYQIRDNYRAYFIAEKSGKNGEYQN